MNKKDKLKQLLVKSKSFNAEQKSIEAKRLADEKALADKLNGINNEPNKKGVNMKSLITWDPIRDLENFQSRLSSFFNRTPNEVTEGDGESKTLAQWIPVVDIEEDDKEYLITAELPEVKKEGVKVTVENGALCISGERSHEKREKNKRYHRIERSYGNFFRSFSLPEDSDAGKINANFKEGVLKVHLPKSEKAKPQEVEVKVQ